MKHLLMASLGVILFSFPFLETRSVKKSNPFDDDWEMYFAALTQSGVCLADDGKSSLVISVPPEEARFLKRHLKAYCSQMKRKGKLNSMHAKATCKGGNLIFCQKEPTHPVEVFKLMSMELLTKIYLNEMEPFSRKQPSEASGKLFAEFKANTASLSLGSIYMRLPNVRKLMSADALAFAHFIRGYQLKGREHPLCGCLLLS